MGQPSFVASSTQGLVGPNFLAGCDVPLGLLLSPCSSMCEFVRVSITVGPGVNDSLAIRDNASGMMLTKKDS
jgi:hypothetical protein